MSLNASIPIYRQCELIGLNRSTFYYEQIPISPYNQLLMNLIDEQYTKTPFYGVPRMTVWLKAQGHNVNHKRIESLMKLMGIQAIYPKRNLSKINNQNRIYPYLLKYLTINKPNQVWASYITYIRMKKGFIYLIAIMDWFSRFVLSWSTSITLDNDFCLRALQKALSIARPEIFNTDQGTQFTSSEFTNLLTQNNIRISMDGRGRAYDNIFIERLWRTVKYEEVYLKDYSNPWEAQNSLDYYFNFYNTERPHQAHSYKTPYEVYYQQGGKT